MPQLHRPSLLIAAGALAGLSGFMGCEGPSLRAGTETEQLRERFPTQADHVLRGARALDAAGGAFVAEVRPGLSVTLPAEGDGEVHFTLADGRAVTVREEGRRGAAFRAEDAIGYRGAAGSGFWSVQPNGAEEWLTIEADQVTPGARLASWTVKGGTLREFGAAVLVLDARGKALLRVTAPAAFAEDGRKVDVDLVATGDRVDLFADADGERLLIDPLWQPATDLNEARSDHTSTTLLDGRVLVTGGYTEFFVTASAELYDPGLDAWTFTGSLPTEVNGHAATLLDDGRVLITGGAFKGPISDCEMYDPGSGVFSPVSNMNGSRDAHTATRLQDGDVLVAGGFFDSTTERYDPSTDTWTPTADMLSARAWGTATLLLDGRVLIAGGEDQGPVGTAEIFDPSDNSLTQTGSMMEPRSDHQAVLLSDGRVLVTGGNATATSEIFDPGTGTWSGAGSMLTPRGRHTLTPLGDDLYVAIGGTSDFGEFGLDVVEVYDAIGDFWTPDTSMTDARFDHGASRLADGRVLVSGGVATGFTPLSTSEIYLSQLGAGELCTDNAECNSGFCTDGVCCPLLCDGECEACSVAAGGIADGSCSALNGTSCTGGMCEFGSCMPALLGNGEACVAPGECVSGSCVDDVCCESSCTTDCFACSVAAGSTADGTCEPVTGAACDDGDVCTEADSCSSGECSGSPIVCVPGECETSNGCIPAANGCDFSALPNGTPCAGGTCQSGECQLDQQLGLGEACSSGPQCDSGFCSDSVCCDVACSGTCDTCVAAQGARADGLCTPVSETPCPGGTCDAGVCVPEGGLPIGSACETGDQCDSTFCTDGVCCGIACDGDCQACSVEAGAEVNGECEGVSAVACDDGDACTQVDTCNAGTCEGRDPVTCEVGVCQISSRCGPSGTCVAVSAADGTPCEGGTCIAGACLVDPDVGSLSGSGSGLGSGNGAANGAGPGAGPGAGNGSGSGSGSGGGDGDDASDDGSGCQVGSGASSLDLGWVLAALLAAAGRKRGRRSAA